MHDTTPRSVLIIDDERTDEIQYRRILRRLGLAGAVSSFSYADEALDWLRAHPDARFDLVLLDVNMPRMNGLEFLERTDARWAAAGTLVAIMLTTALPAETRSRAEAFSSVRAFFSKPLTEAHVSDALRLLEDQHA